MLFKLSNLNSNLSLTLGYINPALNNSAQVIFQMAETPLTGKGNAILLREVYMYIFPLVLISSRSTYAQAYSRFRIKLHFFAISSFVCYATTIWKVPSISR